MCHQCDHRATDESTLREHLKGCSAESTEQLLDVYTQQLQQLRLYDEGNPQGALQKLNFRKEMYERKMMRWVGSRNDPEFIRMADEVELIVNKTQEKTTMAKTCLLYTSPSPRDKRQSRMPSSA